MTTGRQAKAKAVHAEFLEILAREANDTFESEWLDEPDTCPICDGIHGYRCPIESPDPMYYADEMAAGR
jgi:hypothetical protein